MPAGGYAAAGEPVRYAKEKEGGVPAPVHELGDQGMAPPPPQKLYQHEADSGQVHELPVGK